MAQLFNTMSAYAGTYTFEAPDRVVHHVEVAWAPSWVGSRQPRRLQLDGDTLTLSTQPIRNPADGKEYIYSTVRKRAR